MACAAGGRQYGVAANANLFLIKMSNYLENQQTQEKETMPFTPEAINHAFETVWDAFESGVADPTKSVINVSFCKYHPVFRASETS